MAPDVIEPTASDIVNSIGELLALDDVRLDLDVSNKTQLLEQVAALLATRHGLSKTFILESLTAREQLGSTGVGHGVAIPHARMNQCAVPASAFVRTKVAIPFDAPDGKPVSLVFLLLVPEQATEQHLRVLSELAQMLSDRELREKLSTDTDAGTLHQHITAWQPHVADQRRAAV